MGASANEILSASEADPEENTPTPSPNCKTDTSRARGVILIPNPSDECADPLNWKPCKKYCTLFIICFGAFAAATAPIAHQTAYIVIAKSYHHTPVQLTYTISAAIAGLLGGPILITPLSKILGRTSVAFWCFLATIATQIWSARSTGEGDYISFTMSRLFSGLFASVPTVIGSGYIMDIFFIHQRGFAFASYELSLLLGVIASPTIGGFIAESHSWPVVFWWTLVPLGIAALLFSLVLDETEYAPGRSKHFTLDAAESYLLHRSHVLLGIRMTPSIGLKGLWRHFSASFIIAVAPVTIAVGTYALINFAWAILISTELAIVLQLPAAHGGYGFSSSQTAAFTFTSWVALLSAQLFGTFYNDRVPIWIASRRRGSSHGIWHPEDRLWSMLIGPASLSPIGLGIVGAALQYQLHYMVLALGYFLLNFSALLCVPVCVNYAIESFTGHAVETSVAMNAYRLALGLSLSFYFEPWQKKVGVGWLFGMAAFFTVFAMSIVALLAWKGKDVRGLVLKSSLVSTEEGKRIIVD